MVLLLAPLLMGMDGTGVVPATGVGLCVLSAEPVRAGRQYRLEVELEPNTEVTNPDPQGLVASLRCSDPSGAPFDAPIPGWTPSPALEGRSYQYGAAPSGRGTVQWTFTAPDRADHVEACVRRWHEQRELTSHGARLVVLGESNVQACVADAAGGALCEFMLPVGAAVADPDAVRLPAGTARCGAVLFVSAPVGPGRDGRLTLDWQAASPEGRQAAILEVRFLDETARTVHPSVKTLRGLAQRDLERWYQYISPPTERGRTLIAFGAPPEAARVEVKLLLWNARSEVRLFGARLRWAGPAILPPGGVRCGNGVVEPPEVCDGGAWPEAHGCRRDCTGAIGCGDGVLDTWEACETQDGCAATNCKRFADGPLAEAALERELGRPLAGPNGFLTAWATRADPPLPPLVTPMLEMSDEKLIALRAELARGWIVLGALAPVEVGIPPRWDVADGVPDPSWKIMYHAHGWTRAYLDTAPADPNTLRALWLDWIRTNPLQRYSPGWSWDDAAVAWRLELWVNLLMRLPRDWREDPEFAVPMLRSMIEHAAMLDSFLGEPAFYAHNHALYHVRGLLVFTAAFPELTRAAGWRAHALERLSRLLDELVGPDGFSVEEASHYHVAHVAMLQQAAAVFDNIPAPTPAESAVLERIRSREAATRRLAGTLVATGSLLRFGDSPLWQYMDLDVSRWPGALDDPLWQDVLARQLPPRGVPALTWLPDAGYLFVTQKDGDGARQYFFDASSQGTFHGHRDAGNVLVNDAYGEVLVEAGGPYRYLDDADRQYVLSSAAHNMCRPDTAPDQAIGEPLARWSRSGPGCVGGGLVHDLWEGAVVQRETAVLADGRLVVADWLPPRVSSWTCRWHGAEGGDWQSTGAGTARLIRGNGPTWTLTSTLATASGIQPLPSRTVASWTTPYLNEKRPVWALETPLTIAGGLVLTVLSPPGTTPGVWRRDAFGNACLDGGVLCARRGDVPREPALWCPAPKPRRIITDRSAE